MKIFVFIITIFVVVIITLAFLPLFTPHSISLILAIGTALTVYPKQNAARLWFVVSGMVIDITHAPFIGLVTISFLLSSVVVRSAVQRYNQRDIIQTILAASISVTSYFVLLMLFSYSIAWNKNSLDIFFIQNNVWQQLFVSFVYVFLAILFAQVYASKNKRV